MYVNAFKKIQYNKVSVRSFGAVIKFNESIVSKYILPSSIAVKLTGANKQNENYQIKI